MKVLAETRAAHEEAVAHADHEHGVLRRQLQTAEATRDDLHGKLDTQARHSQDLESHLSSMQAKLTRAEADAHAAHVAWEHREGIMPGFTKRYGLKRLVYAEPHDDIVDAIRREKRLKHWPRGWKVRLIHEANPNWDDLYEVLV